MKEELIMDMTKGLIAIGAGLAVMTGMMTGLGEGTCAAHACDAIGKNPEAESKIRSTMIFRNSSVRWSLVTTASQSHWST